MTEEEYIKYGNELIVEFMGFIDYNKNGFDVLYNPKTCQVLEKNTSNYESSWDLLMPVVGRIERHKIFNSVHGEFPVKFAMLRNERGNSNVVVVSCAALQFKQITIRNVSRKLAIWLAVVEFIQWYNENKKSCNLK